MRGYMRFKDFYLCIPETGIYFRSANISRYGDFKSEVFIDGKFIGAARTYKKNYIIRLYNEGYKNEAIEYALGYRLWRETAIGGNKINKYKEAARISHAMCDMAGEIGHDARQTIRRKILYGK